MSKDPYTNIGVRIKREHKVWLGIIAWLILTGIAVVGIFSAAKWAGEHYHVEWP